MEQAIIVGIGGFFGSIARYLTSRYASGLLGTFPLGTLLVNVSGSLLLGFIMYSILNDSRLISPEFRNFAAVGFIGAFTTMSTFAYESFRFAELGDWMTFASNVGGNLVLCFLAIYLGKEAAILIGGLSK